MRTLKEPIWSLRRKNRPIKVGKFLILRRAFGGRGCTRDCCTNFSLTCIFTTDKRQMNSSGVLRPRVYFITDTLGALLPFSSDACFFLAFSTPTSYAAFRFAFKLPFEENLCFSFFHLILLSVFSCSVGRWVSICSCHLFCRRNNFALTWSLGMLIFNLLAWLR